MLEYDVFPITSFQDEKRIDDVGGPCVLSDSNRSNVTLGFIVDGTQSIVNELVWWIAKHGDLFLGIAEENDDNGLRKASGVRLVDGTDHQGKEGRK